MMADVIKTFEAAIKIAKEQEAKSFELRALLSIIRHQNSSNRAITHGEQLRELAEWFQERGETPDLIMAEELLASLPESGTQSLSESQDLT